MSNILQGTDLRIKLDGAVILYATNCSLAMTREMKETVHKDTAGSGVWGEFIVGKITGTLNHSGFRASDGLTPALWTKFVAGTLVTFEFTDAVAGHYAHGGSAYLAGWNQEAPVGDPSTIEVPLQVTGEVTYTEIV